MASAATSTNEELEPRFTKRKLLIMSFICAGALTEGTCLSHIAPFYAEESEKRDNDKIQYGIVFGAYPLVGFFMSPVVGRLLVSTIDVKNTLVAGLLLGGLFTVLTGFLTFVPDGNPFFLTGLLLRSMQSVGFSMALPTHFAIIGAELGPWAHICMGITETVYGASFIAGPAIGGFLFERGGFRLPFFVLGGITCVTAVLVLAAYPKIDKGSNETKYSWAALLDVRIVLNVLMTLSTFIIFGFNEATLAIHLKQFNLSPTHTGLSFIVCGGLYSISGMFWGSMSKRVADPRYFVVTGAAFSCIALALVGPLPIFKMQPTVALVLVMQAVLGIGNGPAFVCLFMHSIGVLTGEKGLPDDSGTYAMLSAILMPASYVGTALGPMIGGFLLEHLGYRNATAIVFVIALSMLLLELSSVIYDNCGFRRHRKNDQEAIPS